MRVLDSRRLTGPNLLLDAPGAVLDVELDDTDPSRVETAWRDALRGLLAAVGWSGAVLAARRHSRGLNLAFTAPLDTLYAATEVNEAAWAEVAAALSGAPPPPREATVAALKAAIQRESKPWLLDLATEAARHEVTLLFDDRRVSVGLGVGSLAWPVEDTARALRRLAWSAVRDVPTVLVTGTNGKTTTARLLGAMATATGRVAGVTSTDAVTVGTDVVAEGDYSGPNGARTVLRDRRVEIGVLEVARGGILRRGLPLPRVSAAVVTNVGNDHLGEFGIDDVASLADAKMVVAKAVGAKGRVVLNADDPLLWERGARVSAPVTWFSLDAGHAGIAAHLARGGDACFLEGDALVEARGSERRVVARVADVPLTFGGAARHNIANALGAIGAAAALGIPPEAVERALREFVSDPARNPGRANVWTIGGARVVLDFIHNPHGMEALAAMMAALPAKRRAVVLGQAGDRDDESIRELARRAWGMRPDRVFIKELEEYLRGRERGVVPAILEAELRSLGAGSGVVSQHAGELEAVKAALEWAEPGDLVLLAVHEQRREVSALLDDLAACHEPKAGL